MAPNKHLLSTHSIMLTLLVLMGLAVRAYYARLNIFPSVDGVFYLEQCRAMVLHAQLPFSSFPPGWPMLASLPLLSVDTIDAMQLFRNVQGVNVALGALWLVLTFLLLRKHLGPWVGLLGAALLAVLPVAITASAGDLSEMSYSCGLVAAFLLLPKRRVLAGFVLGYSYLIRPEALLVVVGVAGVLIWRERRFVWEFLLGTVTCVVPYVFFIHYHTGVWALTGKLGFLEGAWSSHPGSEFLVLIGNNLKTLILLLPGQLGIPLVLLAVLGLVLRPRFASIGLLTLLPLPFFDFAMVDRFWLPSLPFLFLAAGQGAAVVLGSVKFAPQKAVRSVLLVAVLAGTFLVSSDDVARLSINPNRYTGILEAGLWLEGQVSEQTKIAAYKPFASYWAGCKFVKYPTDGDIWQLLDDMEAQGVEYLVVNAHVARVFVPQLQSLLSRDADPGLKLRVEPVKIFAFDPNDQTTIIFRFLANDRL